MFASCSSLSTLSTCYLNVLNVLWNIISTAIVYINIKKNWCVLPGVSTENASHSTTSRTAASATRVTAAPCATSRGSCSTPVGVCPANMAAARSRTRATLIATAKAATPGTSATQVCFLHPLTQNRWARLMYRSIRMTTNVLVMCNINRNKVESN